MKYAITVKPRSSQERIVEIAKDELVVYLRAKPHDGEANDALIKLISKYYKVPKTTVKIVRGQNSHKKLVEF